MREDINFFQEGVVGDGYGGSYIDSYHRTGTRAENPRDKQSLIEYVEEIIKNGFKPGSGDMYGSGLYSTGDWLSQFGAKGNGYMDNYGNAIIKYRTPARGILVFDYRVAKKMYGGSYTLIDQVVKFGLFSANKMPRMIEILSDDLEQTFRYPKVSADRAYLIWNEFWRKGGNYQNIIKLMSQSKAEVPQMPYDLQQDYYTCPKSDIVKNLYGNSKVIGIAFSGNHDGNVLFIKKEALNQVKILQYCIMDWQKPGDPRAFVLPWTMVGSNMSAVGLQGAIKDFLAAAGIPRGTNTFDEVYIQDLSIIKEAAAVNFVKKDFPWTISAMNYFKGLDIAFGKNKLDYIFGGEWTKGNCNVHYFGSPNDIRADLKNIDKNITFNSDELPIFKSSIFDGDEFSGVMVGGIFKRGVFNGIFKGGLIDFDGKVSWGPKAKRVLEKSLVCSIKYNEKIYKIDDASPDIFLSDLKSGMAVSQKGGLVGVDNATSLSEAIKHKLSFKVVNFYIEDNWRGVKNIHIGFTEFKETYPWLFYAGNKITWKDDPVIEVDNTKITLVKGELRTGNVCFDVWDKLTSVIGGNVYNKNNIFNGVFKGGNYREGNFEGTYENGILYLDNLSWGKNAKWEHKGKPTFVFKNRQFAIDDRVLLIPSSDQKTPKYNSIISLINGIKSGEYMRDFLALVSAEMKYKTGRGAKPKLLNPNTRRNKRQVGITQDDMDIETNDWDDDDGSKQESDMGNSLYTIFKEGIPSIENLLREDLSSPSSKPKTDLNEKEYFIRDLSDPEQEILYKEFQNSYIKATGTAFTKDAFMWRADNWSFYGDPPDDKNPNNPIGGIAVRKQLSNDMYKLCASFGNFRSILRGFNELTRKHGSSSIWGFVTDNIKKIILKHNKDFRGVPGLVVKAMEGMIKKLANGEVKSVGLDGSIMVDTPAGVMKKYFIANRTYLRWLIDSVEDTKYAGRIPIAQAVLHPLLALVKALL